MFEELKKLRELKELKTILLNSMIFAYMTIVFNYSAACGCDNYFLLMLIYKGVQR